MSRRPRVYDPAVQPDLFSVGPEPQVRVALGAARWPSQDEFPVNHAGARVAEPVLRDLAASRDPMVVAGFASISKIIEFVAEAAQHKGIKRVRVLLGTEPFATDRLSFGSASATFTDDVRRYWIEEHGVSLRLSAKIVQVIEALEAGLFEVRFVPGHTRLHAKIYLSETAATLGSSNFTEAGLKTQFEANTRFTKRDDPQRYANVRTVAVNFWDVGEPWTDELMALLRDMLRFVSWQEALARACADLLEGKWAAGYLAAAVGAANLWPSQVSGIAEALWVVENVGSVLVADATGSGKTRMGAHLTRAVRDRLWSTGRVRGDLTVLVCPPAVEMQWLQESASCGLTLRTVSHGLLSRPSTSGTRLQEDEVAHAQILAIDEAHNFLSAGSNRTVRVRESSADHVLMFTATPINRGAEDLLSLVDLLGADNFEDAALKVLDRLGRRGHDSVLTDAEKELLRREIQRFTVRRTKSVLNAIVDRDPAAYQHPETGRVCRYPEHDMRSYPTGESHEDEQIAQHVREHVATLTGLSFLGPRLALPVALRHEYDDARWLDLRLGSARGLAAHNVLSAMRSSKAALLEHLLGTVQTVGLLGITNLKKPQPTGNMLNRVLTVRGQGLPKIDLQCELPLWLTNADAWRQECDRELAAYREIDRLAQRLSESRERAKAALIETLAKRHERVLAFDHHPITLAVLESLIDTPGVPVFTATGSATQNKQRVQARFARTSTQPGIALCSDAMNEGINLQGASTVVHFDMPTTLRVAEQRVGRVDRMDSPYDRIEVWWPDDGPNFATHANELLTARNAESSALLGSNLPIPVLEGRGEAPVDQTVFVAEDQAGQHLPWDGLRDALDPVRQLVSGPQALLSREMYEHHRSATYRVFAQISPVQSQTPWAFFAISGTKHGAPRWILLEGDRAKPVSDLEAVTTRLRSLLEEDPPPRAFDDECESWLDRFLASATQAEVDLLPRRDQRALRQMHATCRSWAEAARRGQDHETAERWETIARLACPEPAEATVDLQQVAELWVHLISPVLDSFRRENRRRRYITLSDIDRPLRDDPLPLSQVEEELSKLRFVEPLDRRVKACILGVPLKLETHADGDVVVHLGR